MSKKNQDEDIAFIIALAEVLKDNDLGEIEAAIGDFVSVAIESIEDGFGATKLSRERAKKLAAWLDLEAAMNEGRIVTGMVQGKVKGGLTVLVGGLRAFLPGSLVDVRPVRDPSYLEGKVHEFKIIKLTEVSTQIKIWLFNSEKKLL